MNLATDYNEPAAAIPQPPLNLWLVDDNRSIRTALKGLLERCDGISCTADFPSPNAVLSALASKTGPDVILLDINMGNACGLDAIRPIKSLSRSTQVLMFTTFFDSEAQTRAFSAGASGFLLKSFSIEQILASIHQAKRNPTPHLKRSRAKKPSAVNPTHSAPADSRKHSRWFKQCLDVLRNRQN